MNTLYKLIIIFFAYLISLILTSCNQKDQSAQHLWDKEPTLWEIAQTTTVTHQIPKADPQPEGMWNGGTALNVSTKELKMSLWGPPEQLTISVNKTDVWDRRKIFEEPRTLAEIKRRYEKDSFPDKDRWNHYRSWNAYDFPCPKPVGQIILMIPDFSGMGEPTATRQLDDGSVGLTIQNEASKINLDYLAMMTRNIIAVKGRGENLKKSIMLRLYRHQDTGEYGKSISAYGGPEAKALKDYDFKKDGAVAPPLPPESGVEGDYFWIRQKLPAEKTLPEGFEYVLVGCIRGAKYHLETINGVKYLGTPPFLTPEKQKQFDEGYRWRHLFPSYKKLREALGSAATAILEQSDEQDFEAFFTIVTSAEYKNPLPEAIKKLKKASSEGYNSLVQENSDWFRNFYNKREKGRIFQGSVDSTRKKLPEIFSSWTCPYSEYCLPNPAKFQADAVYGYLEQDWAPWHGLPCYNEVYYTHLHAANRADKIVMLNNLVPFWLKACKKNAREVFNLPGAILQHGYLPPIKADEYAHTHSTWEFCMEINAQVLKPLWDRFDYGADEKFLAEVVYPAMRETAIFYSHYVEKGSDGYYHIIPTVSAEHWNWTPRFARNSDSASALSMFRWLLNRTIEAATLLKQDEKLIPGWQAVADNLAPLPTYDTPEGSIFTDVRDVNPLGVEYNWFAGVTPTILADEINLDSDPQKIEMMLHTARMTKGWRNHYVFVLLGDKKGIEVENLINSRSGRIHLFPGIPDSATVGFKALQARGGFEVTSECSKW